MEEEFEIEELLHHGQEDMQLIDEDFDAVVSHAQQDMAEMGPVGQFAPAETLGPEPGLWDQAADYFIDKMVPEIWDAFTHEVSLGASELAKGLMGHEDPFVLYGGGLEPTQTYDMGDTQSFDAMVQDASAVYGRGQEQELER